jgi:Coenzyme F420-dependent N5,N10-methylene tetrahydromethanopterin reductase and related flavin-dependent oxidoreductases
MEKVQLYTLPPVPPPIYIAATGPQTVRFAGKTCAGLITPGANHEKLQAILNNFNQSARDAGRDPITLRRLLQLHVSWARTDEEALQYALTEWPNGGMAFPKQDIRTPEDFAAIARLVRPEHFTGRVLISADLEAHRRHLQGFIDLGFDEIYVHNVGRNQEEFLRVFGAEVLPSLHP